MKFPVFSRLTGNLETSCSRLSPPAVLAAYARRTYFTEATTRPVARHRGIGPSLGQTLLDLARYTYRRIEDAHYARQFEIISDVVGTKAASVTWWPATHSMSSCVRRSISVSVRFDRLAVALDS